METGIPKPESCSTGPSRNLDSLIVALYITQQATFEPFESKIKACWNTKAPEHDSKGFLICRSSQVTSPIYQHVTATSHTFRVVIPVPITSFN